MDDVWAGPAPLVGGISMPPAPAAETPTGDLRIMRGKLFRRVRGRLRMSGASPGKAGRRCVVPARRSGVRVATGGMICRCSSCTRAWGVESQEVRDPADLARHGFRGERRVLVQPLTEARAHLPRRLSPPLVIKKSTNRPPRSCISAFP